MEMHDDSYGSPRPPIPARQIYFQLALCTFIIKNFFFNNLNKLKLLKYLSRLRQQGYKAHFYRNLF